VLEPLEREIAIACVLLRPTYHNDPAVTRDIARVPEARGTGFAQEPAHRRRIIALFAIPKAKRR